jgi:solute carrier family 50 (sugar transporter)
MWRINLKLNLKKMLIWQIPNGLGVGLATAQLLLYAIYYKSTQRQIEARRNKEEMGLAEVVVIKEGANKVGAMGVSNGRWVTNQAPLTGVEDG